jgi:hypothetical protein
VIERIGCQGAPRDLGLDQGSACRDAIRADARAAGLAAEGFGAFVRRMAAALRDPASAAGSPHAALARDLARHFPHLEERTAGLAAGSGLPLEAMLALLAAELDAEGAPMRPTPERVGESVSLAVDLAAPLAPTGLVVRAVRADGGYPSLSVTRPGLALALAGVNQEGLAAVGAQLAPPDAHERCRAPALLLLEGCIERLDGVEKALDWCERRPGGGRARLVFADAAGDVGAIEIEGEKRRRLALAASAPADPDAAAVRVRVDPAARRIEIAQPGLAAARFEVA